VPRRVSLIITGLLTAAAAALAIWVVVSTIYMVHAGFTRLPVSDDWDRWRTMVDDGYSPGWFFRVHVDHRLVIAKLFFAVDHLVFRGDGWFLRICALCIQAMTAFLLWTLAGLAGPRDRTESILQAAAITALLFSSQQWMNFTHPFQIQFPLVFCACTATVFALWKASVENWRPVWLSAVIFLSAVAAYSMANGNLLWPVLLVAAIWLRIPISRLLVLLAGWFLISFSYFYTWYGQSTAGAPLRERLGRILLFWTGHLGSPVYPLANRFPNSLRAEAITGLLLVIALLIAFVTIWLRRRQCSAARGLLVFFCCFLALTSASMAYGRSSGDIGFMVMQPRYFTPSYLFWASMLLVLWPLFRRVPRMVPASIVFILILTGVAIHQRATITGVRGWLLDTSVGEVAVVDNVTDPDAWHRLFHSSSYAIVAADYLRDHKLAIFSEEWARWPGTPLASHFNMDQSSGACEGGIDPPERVVTPLRPGWRVKGWAWDRHAGRPPRYIVMAARDGKIAGVALEGFPNTKRQSAGWIGYVPDGARQITAYLVEADGHSLCSIGSAALRHAEPELPFTSIGPALPVMPPRLFGDFVPDGYAKGNGGPGKPPVDGPVYGSYPDNVAASMRIGPFHVNGRTQIAIPIVTGGDSHRLSIIIRDPETKDALITFEPPARTTWWAWRPELPAGRDMNIEIEVNDDGVNRGEWIAIGWPHAVRP